MIAYKVTVNRLIIVATTITTTTTTTMMADATSTTKKAVFDPSFLFSAQPYGQPGAAVADYKELLAESNVAFIVNLFTVTW